MFPLNAKSETFDQPWQTVATSSAWRMRKMMTLNYALNYTCKCNSCVMPRIVIDALQLTKDTDDRLGFNLTAYSDRMVGN